MLSHLGTESGARMRRQPSPANLPTSLFRAQLSGVSSGLSGSDIGAPVARDRAIAKSGDEARTCLYGISTFLNDVNNERLLQDAGTPTSCEGKRTREAVQ